MPTKTNLKEILKNSALLRLKVPKEQLDGFVEKILSLPRDKRNEALSLIEKANKDAEKLEQIEIKNAESLIQKIKDFSAKTKTRLQGKSSEFKKSKSSIEDLKTQIKKT